MEEEQQARDLEIRQVLINTFDIRVFSWEVTFRVKEAFMQKTFSIC